MILLFLPSIVTCEQGEKAGETCKAEAMGGMDAEQRAAEVCKAGKLQSMTPEQQGALAACAMKENPDGWNKMLDFRKMPNAEKMEIMKKLLDCKKDAVKA